MLFGALDIHLLTPHEAVQGDAAAMGALAVRMDDAEAEITVRSHCSAFLVSPRHVLTAGHCVRPSLVFDQERVAVEEDVSAFRVVTIGSSLRLRFEGRTISTPERLASLEVLDEPAFVDRDLDFAVYPLSQPRRSAFIDLRAADIAGSGALTLYSYPTGMPLSQASHCRASPSPREGFVLHDCDSMKGSSGGLLVSASRGRPVALHLRAKGRNDAEYFERTGHFETWGDARDDGEGTLSNEALLLSVVARRLEERAPNLWKEIGSAATNSKE